MRDHESRPKLPEDTRAAARDDILQALEFALASGHWKLSKGNESGHALRLTQEFRRQGTARHILDHLETANFRIGQGPPRKPHG